MNQVLNNALTVFKNWRYSLLAFFISFGFYSFNAVLSNIGQLLQIFMNYGLFGTIKFYSLILVGYRYTVAFNSFLTLVSLSLLLGILFSLIVYKQLLFKTSGKKANLFSLSGVMLAAIAPGCAACGIGIVSALGLSSAFVAIFPYDGLELSILAIILLGVSIFKTSKNLYSCKARV